MVCLRAGKGFDSPLYRYAPIAHLRSAHGVSGITKQEPGTRVGYGELTKAKRIPKALLRNAFSVFAELVYKTNSTMHRNCSTLPATTNRWNTECI